MLMLIIGIVLCIVVLVIIMISQHYKIDNMFNDIYKDKLWHNEMEKQRLLGIVYMCTLIGFIVTLILIKIVHYG